MTLWTVWVEIKLKSMTAATLTKPCGVGSSAASQCGSYLFKTPPTTITTSPPPHPSSLGHLVTSVCYDEIYAKFYMSLLSLYFAFQHCLMATNQTSKEAPWWESVTKPTQTVFKLSAWTIKYILKNWIKRSTANFPHLSVFTEVWNATIYLKKKKNSCMKHFLGGGRRAILAYISKQGTKMIKTNWDEMNWPRRLSTADPVFEHLVKILLTCFHFLIKQTGLHPKI